MPKIAVTMGTPIASTDPNAKSSTIAATARPTASAVPPPGVSTASTASPERANVTPSPVAAFA